MPPTGAPILAALHERVRGRGRRIVLPEGHDSRVREAAARALAEELCVPILFAEGRAPDPRAVPGLQAAAEAFLKRMALRGMSARQSAALLDDPLHVAGLMVAAGEADGAVMGAATTTAETLRAALRTVGARPGLATVSSCFLMVLADGRGLI